MKIKLLLPLCALTTLPLLTSTAIATLIPNQASKNTMKIAQLFEQSSPQSTQVEAIAKKFFTLLAQGKYEQALQYFSPNLKEYATADQLQEIWQVHQKTVGRLIEVYRVIPSEFPGTYSVLITVRFEKSTQDFVMTLDKNQRITAINFLELGKVQVKARKFVTALAEGEYTFARSFLSAELKKIYQPELLKQRWQSVLTKTGAFEEIETVSAIKGTNYEAVELRIKFQNYSGTFLVLFNSLGQIIKVSSPLK
ncbi:MAG TPA: DUF3887 domain-containing protein [Leptolyngbyaceae cyanobacterium M33_DOE_097]|uniref:DUF3887 domain-containing protein n=1 Tax=Oscillatoriales cyanobacterium SpSt-418 TaxID=2282169 RepID=A0A7C3PI25_9CYAN|nr:DUF3887 domain-containing protein [Leptolyngbyaceae cyanobacterium M33_DOE_097]